MPDDFVTTLAAIVERVRALAAGDPELRSTLRALAKLVLDETPSEVGPPTGAAHPPETTTEMQPEAIAQPAAVLAVPAPSPMPAQTADVAAPSSAGVSVVSPSSPILVGPTERAVLAAQAPTYAAPMPAAAGVADDELPLIEARCRMKAEGARWAATRRRRMSEGADFRTEIEPLDREIIEKARGLPDCFLWMCNPTGPSPSDLSLYEDVAGCFETMAAAVALLKSLLSDPEQDVDFLEQALGLAAEAQSALRRAVEVVGGGTDKDQLKLYGWLRGATSRHQIYIPRFMRADDPADPAAWADLDARIGQIDTRLQEGRQRQKRRRQAVQRVRFHLKPILAGDRTDHDHHWAKIVQSVQEMVADGVPPSNVELRELLLPVVDRLPDLDHLPTGFQMVLREIDSFLATRPPTPEQESPAEPTGEARAAAKLLHGRSVVLIGGVRRPHAHQALKAAFGLKDLDWVETREHESVTTFEPHVARPDVALVLLAIRWSSHSYGDVKQFCDRYGKPLVRLPAGYGPNQVAAQILSQVSGRLVGGR